MDDKKYPVGTRIMYYPPRSHSMGSVRDDRGRIGTIVGISRHNHPLIYLPESKNISIYSTEQVPATWQTHWSYLKILSQKNQQLEFSFMSAMEGT